MKWEVIVKKYFGNFRLLSEVLACYGLELLKDENVLVLRGRKFEDLKNHSEVWNKAQHVLETLNELSELNKEIDIKLELDGGVVEYANDGSKRKHVYVDVKDTVIFLDVDHAVNVTVSPLSDISDEEREKRERKRAEERYQKRLYEIIVQVVPALDNENVIKVMRMLNSELHPAVMGNIVDLIKDDMKGNLGHFVSNAQLKRFERSINHPKVFAERARHIVSNKAPPPVPMHQNEAELFVKNLVNEWLHYKYDNRDDEVDPIIRLT